VKKYPLILLIVLLLVSCGYSLPQETSEPSLNTPNVFLETPKPSQIPIDNQTPEPTEVSINTETLEPTNTVKPNELDDEEKADPIETVPTDIFSFSNNSLLVRVNSNDTRAEGIPNYHYALLGSSVGSFSDGEQLYDNLNTAYLKTYQIIPVMKLYKGCNTLEEFNKYFFQRKIERVSIDGTRVLCSSFIVPDTPEFRSGEFDPWKLDILYEIYEGDNLIYSYKQIGGDYTNKQFIPNLNLTGCFFINKDEQTSTISTIYYNFATKKEITLEDSIDTVNPLLSDTDGTVYFSNLLNNMYSLENGKKIGSINTDIVLQLISPNEFLTFGNASVKIDSETVYTNETYIKNITDDNYEFLGKYMFDPVLSPDRNDVAYFIPPIDVGTFDSVAYVKFYKNLKSGFYIKDIISGKTTFYPVESGDFEIIGWVNAKGITNLLNFKIEK